MSDDQAQAPQQQFAITRIYVKDVSYEAPNAPQSFAAEWKPELNLEMNSQSRLVDQNLWEVVLQLTVTVKNAGQTAFIVEAQQAGLFLVQGIDNEQLRHLLGAFCPNILFPYARETVSDLVTRGSFPQLLLAPVNFDALFMEAVQRENEQKQSVQ